MIALEQMMGVRSTPLEALRGLSGMHIRERVSYIEALSTLLGREIEMANKYQIYAEDAWMDDIFYAVEQTDFFGRNLKQICGDCAWWNVDIYYSEGIGHELVFRLERPATFTCCCFGRPTVTMTDARTGVEIGSVEDPFGCLGGLSFKIRDPDDNSILSMESGCCPLGLWCPLPMGPCSEIEMTIKNEYTGESVGRVTKKVPSTVKYMFSPDVDDYHVEFSKVRSAKQKALIMAMTIFLDFRYFNDNARDEEMHVAKQAKKTANSLGINLNAPGERTCRSCARTCQWSGGSSQG